MPTFPHEMLREIYEQPQALKRTLDLYLAARALKPEIAAALAHWPNPAGEILIAASGSSRHSGLYGEILLEDLCGLAVDVEYASEYSCRGGPAFIDVRHPSVLVLSQSGETSDTLAALVEARRQGHKTLAISNAAASTIATEADATMLLAAGQEKAVPATKSFTCQLAALYVFALYEGARLRRMDVAELAERIAELFALPGQHLELNSTPGVGKPKRLPPNTQPPQRFSISAAESTTPSPAKARSNSKKPRMSTPKATRRASSSTALTRWSATRPAGSAGHGRSRPQSLRCALRKDSAASRRYESAGRPRHRSRQ